MARSIAGAAATLGRIRQLSAELERTSGADPPQLARHQALVVQIAVEAGAYVKLLDAEKGLNETRQRESRTRECAE